jgi:ribosomal protein L37E
LKLGLKRIQENDPDFSLLLFRDFCYSLYPTLHHARGLGPDSLVKYSSYLERDAFNALLGDRFLSKKPVIGVVIGSFQVVGIDEVRTREGDLFQTITVKFEANYTEDTGMQFGGSSASSGQSFYANESWTFWRRVGVLSKYTKNARQIACPSCGAPAQSDRHGLCAACGQLVRSGVLDWGLMKIQTNNLSTLPPLLTSTIEEVGTELPAILDPDLDQMKGVVLAELGLSDFSALDERAFITFGLLQESWTKRNLTALRPYETDALFETHCYWRDYPQKL